jgi:hypothetical protein
MIPVLECKELLYSDGRGEGTAGTCASFRCTYCDFILCAKSGKQVPTRIQVLGSIILWRGSVSSKELTINQSKVFDAPKTDDA